MANHANLISLIGQKFGLLTVTKRAANKGHHVYWDCQCDCGNKTTVGAYHLSAGATKSCGCTNRTQNGLSMTREYDIWARMLRRCYCEKNDNYRYYGGVGTYVCQRWRESVSAFVEDMGIAPTAKHTIDRINTNGHYTCGKCEECKANQQPANCRWTTKDVQSRNQKSNRYYTHDGKTLILKDWARLTGIKYLTLWNRLNIGVPFAEAISAAVRYDRKAFKSAKRT